MERFIAQTKILMQALEAAAHEVVPESKLVTVDLEPLNEDVDGDQSVDVRILKSSYRVYFLQGTLMLGSSPALKARAVFRKM